MTRQFNAYTHKNAQPTFASASAPTEPSVQRPCPRCCRRRRLRSLADAIALLLDSPCPLSFYLVDAVVQGAIRAVDNTIKVDQAGIERSD